MLTTLLVEDHRPRWFGLNRNRQQGFLSFLRAAQPNDAGERSAREHRGYGIKEVASKFLGSGDGIQVDE